MVSIKDIARSAQVSHSTVSWALRDSTLINPETRARIHKIADPFAGEVVSEIEEFAHGHDYSVILAASHSDADRELRAVHSF